MKQTYRVSSSMLQARIKLCSVRRMVCDKSTTGDYNNNLLMEEIVTLCKHRGIIFPSAEIYNSISGVFDFGPLGVELKKNLKDSWWRDMVHRREDIVGIDCAIISPAAVWNASGHLKGFSDQLVDCRNSNLRYRADQLFWAKLETLEGEEVCCVCLPESETMQEEATTIAHRLAKKKGISGPFRDLQLQDVTTVPADMYHKIPSPATGELGTLTLPPRDFNLMFQTHVGALSQNTETNKVGRSEQVNGKLSEMKQADVTAHSTVYLRPETAQGIFTNYAMIQRSERKKIPFGIAQIGKAFRNEITPRNFIFRSREFEQMEIEYFIQPDEGTVQEHFKTWVDASWRWLQSVGVDVRLMDLDVHTGDKLAHYAKACTDIRFRYPFGIQELMGVAARGDYDLRQHAIAGGKSFEYHDLEGQRKYIPHVIEPSFGLDRLLLALLVSCYRAEEVNGEKRQFFSFPYAIAPVKISVFPLMKNKPEIVAKAREIFTSLLSRYNVDYDSAGAIGRRYRRADEAGTPFCVTVDFDTIEDGTVTVRYRDTMDQIRISISDLDAFFFEEFNKPSEHAFSW